MNDLKTWWAKYAPLGHLRFVGLDGVDAGNDEALLGVGQRLGDGTVGGWNEK
jgi:hypothetical protein